MRLAACALLVFVVLLTSACDHGSEPQAAAARAGGVEFRFRDPDEGWQVSRELVWRARGGWTCLAQALPRVRTGQFLCSLGEQVVLWRVG